MSITRTPDLIFLLSLKSLNRKFLQSIHFWILHIPAYPLSKSAKHTESQPNIYNGWVKKKIGEPDKDKHF